MGNSAYFVLCPRTGDDLRTPHLTEHERPYEVARLLTLYHIDYENFYCDMRPWRQFIEDNAAVCAEEPELRCLAVQSRRSEGCILIVPDEEGCVKWAALVPRIEE